ncbi:TauD/TfdA family dioxygenase [Granulosicoccus sp.]|nr:TauD/TfdA family dioxygenase [Granulosicoccus sp.]MDB4223627.1 TauD/TfdA family dioxygenase [Granulosicoccus sp.]
MTLEVPTKNSSSSNAKLKLESHTKFWLEPESAAESAFLKLPGNCAEELIATARKGGEKTILNTSGLTATKAFVVDVAKHLASDAPGMAVVEQFPVGELTESQNKYVCQLFSQLIGPLISQDVNNTLLYDVKNKHVVDPLKVRKSITNLAQPFHTDGGWLTTPARVIGLFCISNAVQGGGSEMTSLIKAYEELQRLYPQEAAALRKPLPWNKQGEHAKDEQPWEMNPLFENVDTGFMGRYYESYVTSGYGLMGQEIDSSVSAALQILKSIIEKQPRFAMTLKAGDFQLVNNWTTVHARKEFKDSGDLTAIDQAAPQSRHLIRVWCE